MPSFRNLKREIAPLEHTTALSYSNIKLVSSVQPCRQRFSLLVMGFVGISRAVFDYTAQGDDELAIQEGDLLFVFETDQGDGWIKAKKKASEDDDEEPEGLAPANYVENVTAQARPFSVRTRAKTFNTGACSWTSEGAL